MGVSTRLDENRRSQRISPSSLLPFVLLVMALRCFKGANALVESTVALRRSLTHAPCTAIMEGIRRFQPDPPMHRDNLLVARCYVLSHARSYWHVTQLAPFRFPFGGRNRNPPRTPTASLAS